MVLLALDGMLHAFAVSSQGNSGLGSHLQQWFVSAPRDLSASIRLTSVHWVAEGSKSPKVRPPWWSSG